MRVCIDKSKYEKSLASLRDRNNDLGQLRGQMGQFQQQRACGEGTAIAKNVLPSSINAIRTASLKLHEAISAAWCCGDLKHGGHHAKLCLDAEANAEVQLDLAISCQGLSQQQDSRYVVSSYRYDVGKSLTPQASIRSSNMALCPIYQYRRSEVCAERAR